jgi:hypothetical protein
MDSSQIIINNIDNNEYLSNKNIENFQKKTKIEKK